MLYETSAVSIKVVHKSSDVFRIAVINKEPTKKIFQCMITDPEEFVIVPSSGLINDVVEINVTRHTEEMKSTKLLLLVRESIADEAGNYFSQRDPDTVELQFPIRITFEDEKNEVLKAGFMPWMKFAILFGIICSVSLLYFQGLGYSKLETVYPFNEYSEVKNEDNFLGRYFSNAHRLARSISNAIKYFFP
ncbi:hypothetical protein JTE90_022162 [Oedothorax gibbosus]|uniref:MSP domain-containing protein n=1 Tax=Oedothorax gibbosus TaxID=931172 RepID=A0AAV6VUF5_9ARAC|nr:hypothetical protein JTE90_022162 [Oedothorax gibbosus]